MVRLYKKMPPNWRIIVIMAIATIFLLCYVLLVEATEAGPTLSNFTPASGGSVAKSSTTVSFRATDSDGIDDSTIQIKVNGKVVPFTVNHPELGYYETVTDDSCAAMPYTYQRWVSQGPDATQATVTANIEALDVNTVWVSAGDKLGKNATAEWTFNCMLPPVISGLIPANGDVQRNVPLISAKITDNGTIDPASIILKIGQDVCNASFDPSTGIVSYIPSPALTAGTYTVYLEAKDVAGNKQSASSTFLIASSSTGPEIGNFNPANGGAVSNKSTAISFTATDAENIDKASIQVKVNGMPVPYTVTFPEIGHWETKTVYQSCSPDPITVDEWILEGYDYTKATITANNVKAIDHNTVWVSASDKLGNNSAAQWNFDCMLAPVIGGQTPANGSQQTFVPKISATVTDNGTIDPSTIILKVDSNVVAHAFDPIIGTVTYVPPAPLSIGDHSFYLEVKDTAGNIQTANWSCKVIYDLNNCPVVSGVTPGTGSVINATSTTFTFNAEDSHGINNSSVRIVVNGTELPRQNIRVTNAKFGHYETQYREDSCSGQSVAYQVWVEDGIDPNKVSVSASLSNLPDVNSVSATISNQLGSTTVFNSTFVTSVAPGITEYLPSASWTLNDKPAISAKINDNGIIDPNSIVLKFDGNKVSHTFTAAGRSAGSVTYVPPVALTSGIHNVSLEVKDSVGNFSTQSWSFGVGDGGGNFNNAKPIADSTVTVANADISLAVSDTLDIKSAAMTINGQPVNATLQYEQKGHWEKVWDSCSQAYYDVWKWDNAYYYNKGIIIYKPTGLPDGNNTVKVVITNQYGGTSTYSWSFNGKIAPQISEVTPANGSNVTTRTPALSAKITDNSKIASYKMLVDQNEVNAVFDPFTNKLTYTPLTPLPNSSDHIVQVVVYDEVGASTTVSSKFHIEIYPPMAGSTECIACHTGFPSPNHPMSNCNACHDSGLTSAGHGDSGCGDCHGGHPATYLGTNCTSCHTSPHSSVVHISKRDMSTCTECHTADLTREHSRYQDSSGKTLTCNTCHSSTKVNVQQAISSNNTDCYACHTGGGHDDLHSDMIDSNCQTCHSAYLTAEHMNNKTTAGKNLSCSTCHSSTAKDVNRAISAKKLNCSGCHKQGHNLIFVDTVPVDIPLYTGFRWSTPMEASIFTGEPTTPVDFGSGQVVISNRRKDVTVSQVADFYLRELPAKGWTLTVPPPANKPNDFTAGFVYGKRQAHVKCSIGSTEPEAGCRVEIWYK